MRRSSPWLLLLFVLACNGQRPTSPGAGQTQGTRTTTAGEVPLADPGPAPTVVLRAETHDDGATPVLDSRGPGEATVGRALAVERSVGEAWSAVAGVTDLRLRHACDAPAEGCLTLAPGAVLYAPRWLGLGHAQCECDPCTAPEPGTYRFIARSCNGTHRIEGEPFELE